MTRRGWLSGLLLIVRRSLVQHALSSVITVASIALASGLVMAVFCLNEQAYDAFAGGPLGFDAVLGARGSQLQLVLSTVFHLETSPGNIPWSLYVSARKDPRIALAIPYVMGDNYQGFRLVGTTEEIFTRFEYREGRKLSPEAGGRVFDPHRSEAVIGSLVARKTGLRVGMPFNPYHGFSSEAGEKHAEQYVVVGVTEPSNSPSDRVIWVPLECEFRTEGHVLRGAGTEYQAVPGKEIEDRHKELSAVMLKLRSPQAGFSLNRDVNQLGHEATFAWPIGDVMGKFFEKFDWINKVLGLISYLVVGVASGTILASLYNTMNERRREFAILRALGAGRRTVFSAIVLESTALAVLGSVLGYLVYAGIMLGSAYVVKEQTGVVLEPLKYHAAIPGTVIGMVLLGAASGLLPACKAYATDVASHLAGS